MGLAPSSPAYTSRSPGVRVGRRRRRRRSRQPRPVAPGISLFNFVARQVAAFTSNDSLSSVVSEPDNDNAWYVIDDNVDSAGDSCDSDDEHGPFDPPDNIPDATTLMDWAQLAKDNADLVEGLLNCPICLEHYRDPRLLQCGHTFCYPCMRSLWWKRRQMRPTIRCPTCRKVTQLPHGDVQELTVDFRVTQASDVLRELLGNVVNFNQKKKRFCQPCMSAGQAQEGQFYCQECAMHLCHDCKCDHDDCEDFLDHTLQAFNEEKFCEVHGTVCVFECLTCEKRVCNVCILGTCRHHEKKKLTPGSHAPNSLPNDSHMRRSKRRFATVCSPSSLPSDVIIRHDVTNQHDESDIHDDITTEMDITYAVTVN